MLYIFAFFIENKTLLTAFLIAIAVIAFLLDMIEDDE
ncbi:TMhelix containing protein [Vibrio phage 1.047.O._10N.286.55.F2]|nr:TMhelix containing protein [Vibrio phage 1.047.O._10N.286.55.F2]